MDDLTRGCALTIGLLLVCAGVPKVLAPHYAGSAVRRVVTPAAVASDRAVLVFVRLLGGFEIVLGGVVVLAEGRTGVIVGALAFATFVAFTAFVVAAARAGAHCGCWASLSEGPAGGAEVARTAALAAVACIATVGHATGHHAAGRGPLAFAWALVMLAGVAVASLVGGRLAPVRHERVARQLRQQAPPGRVGRLGAWLAFQGGFVHAGTAAGRRRYALARNAPGRLLLEHAGRRVTTMPTDGTHTKGRSWPENRT